MKILNICQSDDFASGGAARVAVEYTKLLPSFGIEAKCLFVYGDRGKFCQELGNAADVIGIVNNKDALEGSIKLATYIRSGRFDAVHHHDGLTWTHLTTNLNSKILRFGHGHNSPPSGRMGIRAELAYRMQARNYHHLFVVSESTAKDWLEKGYPARKTTIISNGVNLDRFQPPSDFDRRNLRKRWGVNFDEICVGYVARLHDEMKGCAEFIELLSILPSHYKGIIAGDGPDRATLENSVKVHGLSSRIKFVGTVDTAIEGYTGFDVLAVTSRFEPFGLVLLEAAACGLPVAMLPCNGGSTEIANSLGASIAKDRSINGLAQIIIELTSNWTDSSRREIRERARRHEWKVSCQVLAKRYHELMNSVVSH